MLTKEEVQKIFRSKETLTTEELVPIVQRYIFDTKGLTIEVNVPKTVVDLQLMHIAHNVMYKYYNSNY